jgi:putative transposase
MLTKRIDGKYMSNYRRPELSGTPIFFTVALADRRSDLLIREIDVLRHAVRVTKTERPFEIDAWVVLPDHIHCIWRLPNGDTDYPTRWRLIKSRFSRTVPFGRVRASHVKRHERGVWQRRYWEHHIRDEADLAEHMRYCWFNPVKHGLVERPEDWAFSSFNKNISDTIAIVPNSHRERIENWRNG